MCLLVMPFGRIQAGGTRLRRSSCLRPPRPPPPPPPRYVSYDSVLLLVTIVLVIPFLFSRFDPSPRVRPVDGVRRAKRYPFPCIIRARKRSDGSISADTLGRFDLKNIHSHVLITCFSFASACFNGATIERDEYVDSPNVFTAATYAPVAVRNTTDNKTYGRGRCRRYRDVLSRRSLHSYELRRNASYFKRDRQLNPVPGKTD